MGWKRGNEGEGKEMRGERKGTMSERVFENEGEGRKRGVKGRKREVKVMGRGVKGRKRRGRGGNEG